MFTDNTTEKRNETKREWNDGTIKREGISIIINGYDEQWTGRIIRILRWSTTMMHTRIEGNTKHEPAMKI